MRRDDQLVEWRRWPILFELGHGLVGVEAVGREHRPLDEGADDIVADVMRDLPAEALAPELRSPLGCERCEHTCPFGVEIVALPEPDEQPPLAGGVGQGEVLEGTFALA